MSAQDSQNYCLTDLPPDVLVTILEYLPLMDLANVRLVCSVLQRIVDDKRYVHLWANATLELHWFSAQHRAIFERAARCGNFESLVKLAVAYLYSEGVPDGPGKGTAAAINGIRATEYLREAELHSPRIQPFSWVLIRPPWASNNMCCKACVCYNLKKLCSEDGSSEEEVFRLYYCIGKALSFHEPTESERDEASKWFARGSQKQCPYCFHELWKARYKEQCNNEEILNTRVLRKAATSGSPDIQIQLCEVYADGFYGGISRDQAIQYIRQMVATSVPVMSAEIFKLQFDMTHAMRYILVDWLLEVAEMKEFPSATVHLAVNILDRYLLRRRIQKTQLQLLGITALVLASRWLDMTIVTIREASWLTDNTYTYEEVVRMMGDVVAALRGDLRRTTVCDFLRIFLKLAGGDVLIGSMAHYLSECVLFHMEFGQFNAAHIAASCVLLAKVLMKQEYPWPASMQEITGFTLHDLRKCCLMIYNRCVTKQHCVTDHRNVKLHAVEDRFSASRFCGISKHQMMSCDELKGYLGIETEPPCRYFKPTPSVQPSFDDAASLSSSPEPEPLVEDCLAEQFNTHRLSSTTFSGGTIDTGGSREDSPVEISHPQHLNERNPSWAAALVDMTDSCCSSVPVLADGGMLSEEVIEEEEMEVMEEEEEEVQAGDDAARSHPLQCADPCSNRLSSLHVKEDICLDRLHQSCPAPFSSPLHEAVPSTSYLSCSLPKVGVKAFCSKTPCSAAAMKPSGGKGRYREPLKSLDNFSFVAMSPAATGSGKLKQSIQSMCT